jgi:hypothetical protein
MISSIIDQSLTSGALSDTRSMSLPWTSCSLAFGGSKGGLTMTLRMCFKWMWRRDGKSPMCLRTAGSIFSLLEKTGSLAPIAGRASSEGSPPSV